MCVIDITFHCEWMATTVLYAFVSLVMQLGSSCGWILLFVRKGLFIYSGLILTKIFTN